MAATVPDLSPDRLIQLAASLRAQAVELERLALELSPTGPATAGNGRGAHS
jgi:hypothetical protein